MKLILAIVHNDDSYTVNTKLSEAGFFVTKISSTGGFLMSGNTTLLIGVADERVEACIALIGQYCKKRVQPMPENLIHSSSDHPTVSGQVSVGGATIFVLNVEKFCHV